MAISSAVIEKIVARSCQGCAFMSYPDKSGHKNASEVFTEARLNVTKDSEVLSKEEFNSKYSNFIY